MSDPEALQPAGFGKWTRAGVEYLLRHKFARWISGPLLDSAVKECAVSLCEGMPAAPAAEPEARKSPLEALAKHATPEMLDEAAASVGMPPAPSPSAEEPEGGETDYRPGPNVRRLVVGDVIQYERDPSVVRIITNVRDTGYDWIYMPEEGVTRQPSGPWMSENSNDPFFEHGWRPYSPKPRPAPPEPAREQAKRHFDEQIKKWPERTERAAAEADAARMAQMEADAAYRWLPAAEIAAAREQADEPTSTTHEMDDETKATFDKVFGDIEWAEPTLGQVSDTMMALHESLAARLRALEERICGLESREDNMRESGDVAAGLREDVDYLRRARAEHADRFREIEERVRECEGPSIGPVSLKVLCIALGGIQSRVDALERRQGGEA